MLELAVTPEGMVSGSAEALSAKVDALLARAQELEKQSEEPFDPKEAGLLVPKKMGPPGKTKRGKRSRLSAKSGSMTLQDVKGAAAERRAEDTAREDKAKEKKQKIEEKKAAAASEKEANIAAFEVCEEECACAVVPCPWAKWKRCPQCGPKKGVCKVQGCVAKRKPLLLTLKGAE